jgi:hypothetical protein
MKTLILFAHLWLEQSRSNKALLSPLQPSPDLTCNDLHENYPDVNIDVERETNLLAAVEKLGKQRHDLNQYIASVHEVIEHQEDLLKNDIPIIPNTTDHAWDSQQLQKTLNNWPYFLTSSSVHYPHHPIP